MPTDHSVFIFKPRRDSTQIKSYAQRLLQKMHQGVNIFEELENEEEKFTAPAELTGHISVEPKQSSPKRSKAPLPLFAPAIVAEEEKLAASALCQIKSYPG